MSKIINQKSNIENKKEIELTGDNLLSFISNCQTNIGKQTFYNLQDEQQQAMIDLHFPILKKARSFYALMMLPAGNNDVNKQLVAFNLITNTVREPGLKDHEHSPMTKWENELVLQTFDNMQPNRVFDFFEKVVSNKITNKRAMFLIREWLIKNRKSLGLWAVKYRKPFKKVLGHIRTQGNPFLKEIYTYFLKNEYSGHIDIIKDYIAVQKGDQSKLAKLPYSVAEGFKGKFKISKEDFDKLFTREGGQFTAKEKRLNATSVAKSGVSTKLDVRKLEIFDLLVYLRSCKEWPISRKEAEELVEKKAKEVSKNISFNLEDVGLILDTSLSMFGSDDQPYHPLLRAMTISAVIKQVSTGFKEYRTNDSDSFFPSLKNQSNYADSLIKALEDGCKTIVIVGDGYENAPFEGAFHQVLYSYKKQLDEDNKIVVIHLNPVFGAESMDSRSLSNLAPNAGIRDLKGLNESMFIAIAKSKPLLAIEKYIKHLANLQNDKCKELMPKDVKKLVSGKVDLLK
jgi:hypothetical protein